MSFGITVQDGGVTASGYGATVFDVAGSYTMLQDLTLVSFLKPI